MTTTNLFVVEKEYPTSRLEGEHEGPFKWIDERVFSANDAHVHDGEPINAEEAARIELSRLRSLGKHPHVRAYRLIERTVKTTDKVLDQ